MKRTLFTLTFLALAATFTFANTYEELTKDFVKGETGIQSISVMTFGPEGILFIGDSKLGKVIALDLNDRTEKKENEPFNLENIESKLASLLGTDSKGVIIHDLAVNPISQNVYLAVSRADGTQIGFWKRPNDITYATILLKVNSDGTMKEVDLNDISHSAAEVPSIIDEGQENWRKVDQRTDAITDMAYKDGELYISGLSNEEFASALRVLAFPFSKKAMFSTIEVYHVVHAKSETEAPIRTFLPFDIDGEPHILAAYTCTPFVSIPVASIQKGKHVKSKTLAEFGFGNMPIDIIHFKKKGKDRILMSNTSKALIRINAEDIPKQKKGLTEPLKEGEYTVGLPHNVWSVVGVSQMDNLNEEHVLVLQRMPNGFLNLRSLPLKWL